MDRHDPLAPPLGATAGTLRHSTPWHPGRMPDGRRQRNRGPTLNTGSPGVRPHALAAATTSRRVVLLAYEHMNVLDLCGPLQAFSTATRNSPPGAPPRYETIVASADGGLVTTGSGLAIATVPVETLETCAIDTLVVPG